MRRSSFAARVALVLLILGGWSAAAYLFWQQQKRQSLSTSPETRMPGTLHPPLGPLEKDTTVQATGEAGPLEGLFHEFSARSELKGALLGFCLLDEQGRPLYLSPLAETALCPASALKTVTTGAALEILGPEFRFETSFSSPAAVSQATGVLDGDLVLKGSGDPTLSTEDLEKLADELVRSGLKKVRGKLRADATVFDAAPMSDHWNWGDIGNGYGAGSYGINVDHNRFTAVFAPGKQPGEPAGLLEAAAVAKGTEFINQVTTGASGSGDQTVLYSEPFGRRITLAGTVPLDAPRFATGGAIPDPVALALEIVAKRLKAAGVSIAGEEKGGATANVVLVAHRSAPLPEIIDHLHKVSDNLEAQCLFLTLGQRAKTDPVEAIRQHWVQRGVSCTAWRMLDGSGLARANMIRPVDLARINHTIRHGERGERFLKSLSVYGNGTISSKLGAMSGVKTEVGFLRCPDGRELTFALMANGLGTDVDFWSLKASFLEAVRNRVGR